MLAVALVVAATILAFAADPVFPPGARVGMVPLVGLNRAKAFIGFETEDQGVKVLIADLPAEAYGEVANAFKANPGGIGGIKPESIETAAGLAYYTVENAKDGATNVRRYSMIVPGPALLRLRRGAGPGKRLEDLHRRRGTPDVRHRRRAQGGAGRRAARPDAVQDQRAQRASRMSARWRRAPPLILADGDETTGFEAAPFMIIGLIGQTAASPDDRGRFAQQIATTIPGVRDGTHHHVRAGPHRRPARLRDADRCHQRQGQYARHHRAMAALRRRRPALRIIGSSPRDQWAKAFPRFRAVRDGIQPRG